MKMRPPVSKTSQFVKGIKPQDEGEQAFYREALADIPHPLEKGKTLNYGQFQDYLAGPNRKAALDAYTKANKLASPATAESYSQDMFDQAKGRMLSRGEKSPNTLAFPETATQPILGPRKQYATPTGGKAWDSSSEKERFAASGKTPAYAAPGMPVTPAPSVEEKKKMSLAQYAKGTKKVEVQAEQKARKMKKA